MLITSEAREIQRFINEHWPKLTTKLEVPLRELFPEPKTGLKHIWKYGSCDVLVYKNGKLIAVFEPGGSSHFTDEKQIRNDKAKYMLCKINGVACLKMANSVLTAASKRQLRRLLGKEIFK